MVDEKHSPGSDQSEIDLLVRKAQEASSEAADAEEELIRRYLPLVLSLTRPLYLWGWDSEDFIQEGTLGLIKAIRSYDADRSPYFGAYAKACVVHQLGKALEANLRKKDIPRNGVTSLDGENGELLIDRTLPEMDETIISQDEQEWLLSELLKVCSFLEKKVLDAYLKGYSFDEMSIKLNVPKRSIQNAMYRIRAKSEKIQKADNQA